MTIASVLRIGLLAAGLLFTACSSADDPTTAANVTDTAASEEPSEEPSEEQGAGVDQNDGPDESAPAGSGLAVDYDAEPAGDALRGDRNNPAFPPPVVDPALIVSVLPPDGIPAIDEPVFAPAGQIDFLTDEEAIVAVEANGVVKGYPIQILTWHEIVNDDFDGQPVSVTYCPLCNSALAFDRRFGRRTLDFGTSGELYQSALVMYDRQTGSLWAHFTGQGLVGHYAGAQLDFIPAQTLSFARFRSAHPDAPVLTTNTGYGRDYGDNPYDGYDNVESAPYGRFLAGDIDPALPAMARVVGIADDAGAVAIRLDDVSRRSVLALTDGGRNLVVFHRDGLASPLEADRIPDGRDVGQTGVFVARGPDGSALTFTADDNGFVDDETGTRWDVLGRAVEGPLAGNRLERVTHLDTFWFAWSTYRPDTVILEP
jgi:hypothetical protein